MAASFIFYSSSFFSLSRIYRIAYSAVATKNRYSILRRLRISVCHTSPLVCSLTIYLSPRLSNLIFPSSVDLRRDSVVSSYFERN